MKKLITIVLAVLLGGCSSQQGAINSDDLDAAVIGKKPEGYPKTYIKSLPDRPGFCIKVTENWKAHDYQGQTIWLKEKKIESLNCPWDQMQWQDRSFLRRDQ
ncbi:MULTISPECIES: hypothetical protein [unclassified Marinobacter]|uniref:hypothetical protein n=1 Tax=unclassified Marinobacter TaxID=83889 RepID=UPI000BF2F16D|nr:MULTISPECIES: hypothetical protein [unclassified Marinobacter]PFG11462.1 hypothetical protein ATI45_3984 [Marinobacter sp. LV10MA510-1]PFG53289.1 hypothetical protein ATG98_2383 [Marinobacter sp. LV10R520-4]